MRQPMHPGILLRRVLRMHGLNVTDASDFMGIARPNLSNIINGHFAISIELALRIEKTFGGSAESWLIRQMRFDLWRARRHGMQESRRRA